MHNARYWAIAVLVFGLILSTATIQADDWKPLFNGKDLTGWQNVGGKPDSWKAEDGILFCTGTGGGGWLSTDKEYANYELELEFKVPPGGNSGVFLRSPHEGDPAYTGMEIQVLDDEAEIYAKLQPYQYCGGLYGLQAPAKRVSKKAGEWQKYHIVADGRHIKTTLNGTLLYDANLDDYKAAEASHPGIKRTGGYIGLQNHGSRLDYRNIRIKELK